MTGIRNLLHRIQSPKHSLTLDEIIKTEPKTCRSTIFTFSDHAHLSLREPKRPMFPLSLSTSSN